MNNTMPMLTDSERDNAIRHAKNMISISAFPETVLLSKIALASLTAEPTHQVQLDDAWVDLSEGAMHSQLRHGATARTVYTAPPLPALKPIKLSDGFLPSTDTGSGGMRTATGGYWLSKVDVIKAIRAAGYEVTE